MKENPHPVIKSTQLCNKGACVQFYNKSWTKTGVVLISHIQTEETQSYLWKKFQLAGSRETGPPELSPTIHKHRPIAPVHVPPGPAVLFLLPQAPSSDLNVRQWDLLSIVQDNTKGSREARHCHPAKMTQPPGFTRLSKVREAGRARRACNCGRSKGTWPDIG